MEHEAYTGQTALDPQANVDYSELKNKSVIVTGGANGLGREFAKQFVEAGAFVTIGDLNEEAGSQFASELGKSAQFINCDTTKWEDQISLFKAAVSKSPNQSCDIVLANAGISAEDDLISFEETDEPKKPNLRTLDVNLTGTAYTAKLAMHHFARQPETKGRDRCLIMTASLAGYLDQPGTVQYNCSKWGVRSLMRTYRRTCWQKGIRVNIISPWYIETAIMPEEYKKHLASQGVKFAAKEDAAAAVMHIASDPSINGRSIGVVPRQFAEKGYLDLKSDDYEKGGIMFDLENHALHANLDE